MKQCKNVMDNAMIWHRKLGQASSMEGRELLKMNKKYSKNCISKKFDYRPCLEANSKPLLVKTLQRVNLKALDIPGIDLCDLMRHT
jgi:hypothetical protein